MSIKTIIPNIKPNPKLQKRISSTSTPFRYYPTNRPTNKQFSKVNANLLLRAYINATAYRLLIGGGEHIDFERRRRRLYTLAAVIERRSPPFAPREEPELFSRAVPTSRLRAVDSFNFALAMCMARDARGERLLNARFAVNSCEFGARGRVEIVDGIRGMFRNQKFVQL